VSLIFPELALDWAFSLSELGLVQALDELREGRLESPAVIAP
jgi:hypothetical protein